MSNSMIDEPKISVVVPMYNAEKYLKFCIESILEQTFKNFELILIDDCSTDNTIKIAENFNDERIKLIRNKKNLGNPGAVRNVGIENACGEFIFFMDNDDFILPEAFETLLQTAEKNNADVVYSTKHFATLNHEFENLQDIKCQLIKYPPAENVSTDLKTRIWQEFALHKMHVAPWLFFHRKKFLLENNIKFPNEVAEDVFFTLDVIFATDKIIKIDYPFYIWRPQPESASHRIDRLGKNINSVFALHDYIIEKLKLLDDDNFTSAVLIYSIAGVMRDYVVDFVLKSSDKYALMAEIKKAIEPRFKENTYIISTLLQIYFSEINSKKY